MYRIYRNNKRFSKLMFKSYEQARQHARKVIRDRMSKSEFNYEVGGRWNTNPPLYAMNFTIKAVN